MGPTGSVEAPFLSSAGDLASAGHRCFCHSPHQRSHTGLSWVLLACERFTNRFVNTGCSLLISTGVLTCCSPPGPAHPSLGNLVVPDSQIILVMQDLVQTPNGHSTLQCRSPVLQRSSHLSIPSCWDYRRTPPHLAGCPLLVSTHTKSQFCLYWRCPVRQGQ